MQADPDRKWNLFAVTGTMFRMEALPLMDSISCRDCGYQLAPDSRGCPECALNLEAERMIDRFVWRRVLPALALIAIIIALVVVYVVRGSSLLSLSSRRCPTNFSLSFLVPGDFLFDSPDKLKFVGRYRGTDKARSRHLILQTRIRIRKVSPHTPTTLCRPKADRASTP